MPVLAAIVIAPLAVPADSRAAVRAVGDRPRRGGVPCSVSSGQGLAVAYPLVPLAAGVPMHLALVRERCTRA